MKVLCQNKGATPNAAVVIPVYRQQLSRFEQISLKQINTILARYPQILIAPEGLIPTYFNKKSHQLMYFNNEYFKGADEYSALLLSKHFYNMFSAYEYILIVQLDAFVFKDELEYWTSLGFDYIGAPWTFEISHCKHLSKQLPFMHRYGVPRIIRRCFDDDYMVGNGGFSLRKVKTFIHVLEEYKKNVEFYKARCLENQKDGIATAFNEDVFWGIDVPRIFQQFKKPKFSMALKFAFEWNPYWCYRSNHEQLPFGCHGWQKGGGLDFWRPFVMDYGYNLSDTDALKRTETGTACGNVDCVHSDISLFSKRKMVFDQLEVQGWFIDPISKDLVRDVYVLLNDVEYKADYGLDRPDVAMGQKNQKYFPCGFKLQKKATMLEDGEYIIKVRGINVKGNEYYELLYPGSIHIKSKGIFAPFFRFKGMAFRKSRRAMCLLLGFLKEPFFFFSLLKNLGIILFETKRRKKIALVNLDEHIGDIVACEPVSRIVRKESPDAYILWLTKYRYKSLVQHNPAIDLTLGLTCLFEWVVLKTLIKKLIPALKLIDLHIHKRLCTSFGVESKNENDYGIALENYFSYGNILETFLMAANLPKNDLPPLFYFKKGFRVKVPLNCIVLHCSSNELSKDWEDQKWNDLAALLTGAGYQVAEVGLHNKLGTVHSSYDFCGKLSLQGIAFFIKKSKLFIGIDSAFAHVANAVDTPGVILLGHYRRFQKYMPYSGRYKNGHNATVIQYNGYVKDIPTQIVFEAVIERLKLSKGRDEYFL